MNGDGMQLRMIRCGMLAGFALLLAVAVLEALATGHRPTAGTRTGVDDISDQVWQVLAEARKITEESA